MGFSPTNILITDSVSYKSSVISKFIKKKYNSVNVYMISSTRYSNYLHTKYCDGHFFISNINPKDYLTEIMRLINTLSIDYIIPVNSKEFGFFLENRDSLSPCLDYLGALESFQKLNDKNNFSNLCVELKIPIPKTIGKEAINSNFEFANYVFKPTQESGSKGIRYFKSKPDLMFHCQNFRGNFVVQEYVSGVGGGLSVFSNKGKIIEAYGHSRILEYPPEGGSSSMRTRLPSKVFNSGLFYVKKILDKTNWSGFCMFEIKYNGDKIIFIEANPRIWGSIGQGLYDGTNYFSHILGQVKNRSVSSYSYNSSLSLLSFILGIIRGNLPKDGRICHCIQKGRPDIDFFEDPKAYVAQFLKII